MIRLMIVVLLFVLLLNPLSAQALDQNEFANQYFAAWKATQAPNATVQDIAHYLSMLTDDIGHQHLPYDPDDDRASGNKSKMLEGMKYYLGAHTKYHAKLLHVTSGFNVLVLTYATASEGVHPQTKELIKQQYTTIEVLELEEGKVSTIRKYSE